MQPLFILAQSHTFHDLRSRRQGSKLGSFSRKGIGGDYLRSTKVHAIGDSSPPNTLLKQEGLQLAQTSFRDQLNCFFVHNRPYFVGLNL